VMHRMHDACQLRSVLHGSLRDSRIISDSFSSFRDYWPKANL
jgi:hypothetical protein